MDIVNNLNNLLERIPSDVKLIAVSKSKSAGEIMEAYNSGFRQFGENKVQELVRKHEELPGDIAWHMVGHLQSNKVKYIAPFIHLIHSVDSYKLLNIINKEASKHNRIINCLLQVHIAKEETKFGLSEEELHDLLASNDLKSLKAVRISGLMGMATFTSDKEVIRSEYRFLKNCFMDIRKTYFAHNDSFKELSMGMSDDYPIAIEEGSTMVRIGSLIFGARNCSI